jgi:hypothetical protein
MVFILFSFCLLLNFKVDAADPASVNDPLITKSYLEEQLKKLGQIPQDPKDTSGHPSSVPSNTLTIIQLQQTQTLYGGAGSEIIVRSGKVVAVSSDESGMADVTIGKDITAGTAVELNHLLIVPREGRGIKPDPKNKQDIFVMVRGGYTILNADGTKVTP